MGDLRVFVADDHAVVRAGLRALIDAAPGMAVVGEAADGLEACALVPGLIIVARKLQWGKGGDWRDGSEFFGDVLATTWLVLQEWSGQDRPYAVLDLLSAIRCRLRRQLFGDVAPFVVAGERPNGVVTDIVRIDEAGRDRPQSHARAAGYPLESLPLRPGLRGRPPPIPRRCLRHNSADNVRFAGDTG